MDMAKTDQVDPQPHLSCPQPWGQALGQAHHLPVVKLAVPVDVQGQENVVRALLRATGTNAPFILGSRCVQLI